MATKVIFVLAAFLAVSVLAEGRIGVNKISPEKNIKSSYDTLIEIVEQLLLGINKLFSEAVHEVAYGMITMFQVLGEFRDFGIQLAEQVVNDEVAILNAWINKYKNETDPESTIIWQCIQNIEDEYVQIQDQGINSSLFCIDSEIQRVGDGVMQVLVDIRTLNEDLRAEEKYLETCKNETSPVDCIKGVFDKLWNIVVTITTVIETDADKAQGEFDNLGAAIQKCVNDTQAFVQKENERVFNDFSQCVAEGEQSTPSF